MNAEFCQAEKKIYVGYCETALRKLHSHESNTMYRHMYVNYHYFNAVNVKAKCVPREVIILDDKMRIVDRKNQLMAVCYGRPAVSRPLYNRHWNPFHDDILIYVWQSSMVIFENQTEYVRVLDILDYVKRPDPTLINDKLFMNLQPYSVPIHDFVKLSNKLQSIKI